MATILMSKDTPVLRFDLNDGDFAVLNELKLPYQLKGKLRDIPEINDGATKYELTQTAIAMNKNAMALTHYFASRVLPLTRENAKKLYNLFGFDQAQDDHTKALVAIACRSVSLQDSYWVKDEADPVSWKDVNLWTNHLSETVALVALHGTSLTLRGEAHTPEINGQGAYAKAWKNDTSGLFMYKLGSHGEDYESKIEVMVSKLLDKSNIPHIHYYDAESDGRYACKCKCMSNENRSMLSGLDFISYCNVNGIDANKEMLKIDADSIYKMWIADYLISNSDRHSLNWGFFYNADTMAIIGCHPLYDHNNAFDKELMKDKNAPYIFGTDMTMQEAARYAMKHTDVHFFDEVTPSDFMNNEQYENFRERAESIGINIAPNLLKISFDQRLLYANEKNTIEKEIASELNGAPSNCDERLKERTL
ncbi:MAG: hypothetical protein K6G10_07040 [Butyrivibrio sp.]|nr:hypothetical protein [Butyrivibrio sp.]